MVLKSRKHEYSVLKIHLINYTNELNARKGGETDFKALSSPNITKLEYNMLKKQRHNYYSNTNYIRFLERKIKNIESLLN